MISNKKILVAGSECVPFVKTGGLADVLGTLPAELQKLGADVRVILPLHAPVKEKYRYELRHVCNFYIHLGWRTQFVGIETMEVNGVTYYFVDNEFYFGGPIYKGGEPEAEQYAFFTRAILECLPAIDFMPDIIHCNDWQTAMIPFLLKTQYWNSPQREIKTLLTIHNIRYQGRYNLGMVREMFGIALQDMNGMEAYGDANYLKAGIAFADKVNTVSPTYAEELKSDYFAEGLAGIIAYRSEDFCGILNGIDTDAFDPAGDACIAQPYTAKDMQGKAQNKAALIEELGMGIGQDAPIIGIVSRLTEQKGIDLIQRVLGEIMECNVGLVVLGSGDSQYENFFHEAAYQYCGRLAYRSEYNEALAHRIYAGSDFFLMPSRFEPCGISQMIALRYGTLPIVRETGGLADTVAPYNEYTSEGSGFTFTNYNAHDMLSVIRLALRTYENAEERDRLIRNAMAEDNSFAASARAYAEIFAAL